ITVVDVSDDAKQLYDMPAGAFVYEVAEGSAAEKAGIRKGDVVTKFDDVDISSADELVEQLTYYKVGETVTVELQSANAGEYESREVEVTLQEGASAAGASPDKEESSDDSAAIPDENGIQELPFEDGDGSGDVF
ncbi:MAG: PDZ domain-containing protein, partial [Lachnospiraceae bacterium]|nr:PDZ domain-containing protein [Lachnospiraceae bacterium]